MIKRLQKLIAFSLILIISLISFIGCSSSKPGSRLKEIKPVKVQVEGVEFKVGESKVSDLIKGGLLVATDGTLKNGIDGLKIDKMTYYLAYVHKDGYSLGNISFVNNTKDSLEYKDCIISEYTMKFKNDTPQGIQHKYDKILVDGINFNGMGIDAVKEVMSKKTKEVSDFKEPDGSIAILKYTVDNVEISISFDARTKLVSQVVVQVYNTYFES
ncbi:hypothetical protein SAMN02745163_01281 [Clostridium cavendishii DSM 21758]|uniref:Lipoprotein n=1 Tax=Clostridium cavendishii DSM 21758 TaxID=1121302 RepID=A0A1M6GGD0_9CLOT|nr:hypothetical protein [Clostridium cavendishii]SHJ08968.1 hypothetical protein SAMN02745163_01281 [Clostridium cavendishii DSM 21758]